MAREIPARAHRARRFRTNALSTCGQGRRFDFEIIDRDLGPFGRRAEDAANARDGARARVAEVNRRQRAQFAGNGDELRPRARRPNVAADDGREHTSRPQYPMHLANHLVERRHQHQRHVRHDHVDGRGRKRGCLGPFAAQVERSIEPAARGAEFVRAHVDTDQPCPWPQPFPQQCEQISVTAGEIEHRNIRMSGWNRMREPLVARHAVFVPAAGKHARRPAWVLGVKAT